MLKGTASLLVFIFIGTISYADDWHSKEILKKLMQKRSAAVVDISGEETELSELTFEPDGRYHFRFTFPGYGSSFIVVRKPVELQIPMNLIASMKFSGDSCSLEYQFMGKKQAASGKYLKGKFTGSSDFGDFTLESDKVKEIRFTEPAIKIPPPKLNVKLSLIDGTKVKAGDIRIIDLFVDKGSSIYINWAPMNTFVFTRPEVKFLKGLSTITVPFEKIGKLEFLPEDNGLSITLKSGKAIKGTYTKHDEKKKETIDGISGVSEKGGFFIKSEDVKTVTFEEKKE